MKTKITNIEWDGIDHADHPDYCDAYIVSCCINGEPASEQEVEQINEDSDLKYELLMKHLS